MCRMRSMVMGLALAACGGGGGAAEDAGVDPDAQVCESDTRGARFVYNGTSDPNYAPLSAGQVLAVGAWTGSASGGEIVCSGTLIAPEWVLTAAHCGIGTNEFFCFGPDAGAPVGCLGVAEVHDEPVVTEGTLDMTLVHLSGDATVMITGVEPIPVVIDDLPAYVGQLAETAGFGDTENNTSGDRLFAVETIDSVGTEDILELVVNGMGQRGVCFGDSGGPVLVIDSANAPRVAGVLSWGDPSCVDYDRYTRADLALEWIESFTGATPVPDGAPCGSFDAVGRCSGARAIWCQDEVITSETCTSCGWDETAAGFRCIDGADPCQGWDRVGGCDGDTAHWCDSGSPRAADCGCLGQICTVDLALGGAGCIDDPCMGIDYLGECQGNVAVWCEGGELQMVDCTDSGETCQYIDDEVGWYCQ